MDPVTQFDMSILHAIHDNLSCGFLDITMPIITMFAEYGIFWILVSLILVIIRKYRRCGIACCGGILTMYIIGNLILKHAVARARPCWIEPDYVEMLIAVPKDYSFPSGHTMVSFTVAAVLLHYNKKFGIPALVLAVLVAFSRLYMFVHFPTDVLAGAVIGGVIGVAAFIVTDKAAEKIKSRKAVK